MIKANFNGEDIYLDAINVISSDFTSDGIVEKLYVYSETDKFVLTVSDKLTGLSQSTLVKYIEKIFTRFERESEALVFFSNDINVVNTVKILSDRCHLQSKFFVENSDRVLDELSFDETCEVLDFYKGDDIVNYIVTTQGFSGRKVTICQTIEEVQEALCDCSLGALTSVSSPIGKDVSKFIPY